MCSLLYVAKILEVWTVHVCLYRQNETEEIKKEVQMSGGIKERKVTSRVQVIS